MDLKLQLLETFPPRAATARPTRSAPTSACAATTACTTARSAGCPPASPNFGSTTAVRLRRASRRHDDGAAHGHHPDQGLMPPAYTGRHGLTHPCGAPMTWLLRAIGILLMLTAVGVALSRAPDRPVESLVARWAPPPSEFIDLDGQLVHLRDVGPRSDRLPIVLLHGTSASLHTWAGWEAELSKTRRVISFDLPGFGLTGPRADGRYGLDDDARFTLAVLDRLQLAAGGARRQLAGWAHRLACRDAGAAARRAADPGRRRGPAGFDPAPAPGLADRAPAGARQDRRMAAAAGDGGAGPGHVLRRPAAHHRRRGGPLLRADAARRQPRRAAPAPAAVPRPANTPTRWRPSASRR
jgi:hypothetical protein